jgi:hypothetical protein
MMTGVRERNQRSRESPNKSKKRARAVINLSNFPEERLLEAFMKRRLYEQRRLEEERPKNEVYNCRRGYLA